MKINGIELNCRRGSAFDGDIQEYQLYIFRSPVTVVSGSSDVFFPGGTAVIYSSGQPRRFRPADRHPLRYEYISYKPSSADKQYAASMNVPYGTPVKISDRVLVSNTFRSMKARIDSKDKHTAEFMEISMRLLLITIFGESAEEHPSAAAMPKQAQLNELRNAIYADPMRDWSTDKICRDLCISRTYFYKLYLSAFGVTCRQDVIESRLLHAASLLAETDMSVSSVAEKCGYVSDSYFMRQFREHRGCTPSEFRRRCSADGNSSVQGENIMKTLKKRFT